MKIEVWTDFVCPFCYIGKRQLQLAIDQLPFKEHVMIEYKSFQFYKEEDGSSPKQLTELLYEDLSIDQSVFSQLMQNAEEIGILCELDELIYENTFDAHRFMKYACTQNKEDEVIERLLKGYFQKKERITHYNTFMTICEELSFNKEEVGTLLQTKKFTRAVKLDQIEAEEIGVDTIPFYLFNEEIALSGSQSVESLMNALQFVWDEMGQKPSFSLNRQTRKRTTYCEGNKCEK